MKTLSTSLFLSVFCFSSFCQDWQIVETNEQFSISVADTEHKSPSDGIHHQRLIFKYENHTSAPIELQFNRQVKYADAVTTQEQDFVVTIPVEGTVQYDASKLYDKTYYIFKKDHDNIIKRSLQDFQIINLRIN